MSSCDASWRNGALLKTDKIKIIYKDYFVGIFDGPSFEDALDQLAIRDGFSSFQEMQKLFPHISLDDYEFKFAD